MCEGDIITGNKFKLICDDFIDQSKPHINIANKPKTIFCYTDWVEVFIERVLPQIDYKFKLVTHNADRCVSSKFNHLLNDERLIQWFGMNCHIKHPKLTPIPIGIANEQWSHGDVDTLLDIASNHTHKTKLVYSNFNVTTNYSKRSSVLDIIKNKSYVDIDTVSHSFKDYLSTLQHYKYTISPHGNSVDCHRIWESIYLGVIPIVENHTALDNFKDLPILFVDNFSCITEETLLCEYERVINKPTSRSRFSFYKRSINA